MNQQAAEVARGERFEFAKNWARCLDALSLDHVQRAEASLKRLLEVERLAGQRFVDVGSGSGLFSLAARRLGAQVHSFDYDPRSVACTAELKRRFFPEDAGWTVAEGSVLDERYLQSLGRFDIVYSWGVLHHTGQMWRALDNVSHLVEAHGKLVVAIYNDQGRATRCWMKIKRGYNRLSPWSRFVVVWPAVLRLWGPTMIRDLLRGRPCRTWLDYKRARGMSPWQDVIDWVGGWPFEVAKPEEIFEFYRQKGFVLTKLSTSGGGHACNEFVFVKGTVS